MAGDATEARREVARWTGAAAAGFLCNCAVGIRAARAPLPPRARWVHHALYVLTTMLTAGALVRAAASRHAAAIPLAATAVPLALLPRFPGRSRAHPATAAACAPGLGAALGLALWERGAGRTPRFAGSPRRATARARMTAHPRPHHHRRISGR